VISIKAGPIRIFNFVLCWLWALALLFLAAFSRDPLLFEYRSVELPLLGGAAIITGAWAGWRLYRHASRQWLALLLVPLVAIIVLGVREVRFLEHRQRVLNATPDEVRQVGRHVIAGYIDLKALLPLIEKGAVGGVFITSRNVAGQSVEQIRDNIRVMQAARRRNGLCPLVIATDQEGGRISRMSPPLTALPALAQWLDDPANTARAYGEIHGRELASLGVNVNFAPIADLKPETPSGALDFHSQIGRRAISADPSKVATVTRDYVEGLGVHGVKGTLKHFPGLGRVPADTHHFSAALDTPLATLERSDWLPFRYALAQGDALLMLGHVKMTAYDPDRPVSFSRRVVNGIIRVDWKHDGVLVTDDLTMGAVTHSREGIGNAAVLALQAGVDLLLVSYDADKVFDVLAALLAARQDGMIDAANLRISDARLDRTFGWRCR
jgi:beta-N-acetylhexosaminidase